MNHNIITIIFILHYIHGLARLSCSEPVATLRPFLRWLPIHLPELFTVGFSGKALVQGLPVQVGKPPEKLPSACTRPLPPLLWPMCAYGHMMYVRERCGARLGWKHTQDALQGV